VARGEYPLTPNYIDHANTYYQRPDLHRSVCERFAGCKEVSVHRGFLPEALDGRAPELIAWLHIDLNAALPEVQTLHALFDRVVPSGFVILDDYGWLVLRGQKEAEDEFFSRRGYEVLELPTGQGLVIKRPADGPSARAQPRGKLINLDRCGSVFAGITPYSGSVPGGFSADFLGVRTAHEFLPLGFFPGSEAVPHQTHARLPDITDGETWFEAVNWVEVARAARGQFTMFTLGANYGAQAVGAFAALRMLNPMPCMLVAVEPVPENLAWARRHMRENGIDPDQHWLIGSAISDNNAPMLFPVGSPGSGAQNGFATNEPAGRENYLRAIQSEGRVEQALTSLLLHNTTGLMTNLVPGLNLPAEIKLVSCVTLRDIVSAFDQIDYIESDIQQSEILVFPPAMELLKQKVRRVHIGTHGAENHADLRRLFVANGWELVFDFAPNSKFETTLGVFETNDGVLTVVNPVLRVT
jgi:FkbM family methyltransferase